MKKTLSIITALIFATCLSFLLTTPSFATDNANEQETQAAQPEQSVSESVCSQENQGTPLYKASGCGQETGLESIIITILRAVIVVCGVVSVIYVVVGGYGYMTSSGDAAKVEKAKKTIIYALIGLAVCVLSFVIVDFVIKKILGQ